MGNGTPIWTRLPGTWKVMAAVIAFVGLGAGGATYLGATYVSREDYSGHVRGARAMQRQVRQLREGDAKQTAELGAIRQEISEMRTDVRRILDHLLEGPRRRHGR